MTNIKPFTYILGRNSEVEAWVPDILVRDNSSKGIDYPYTGFRFTWKYAIPYKGNEYLCDTVGEYYKLEFGDLVEVNLSTGTFLAVFIQKTDDVATVVPYSDVAELVKVSINDIKPYKE